MKLDPKTVADQVARLRFTNYYPRDSKEGEAFTNELADVLMFAKSEIIVLAVVNEWLWNHTEKPTLADIHALVKEHNARSKPVVYVDAIPQEWKDNATPITEAEREGLRKLEELIHTRAKSLKATTKDYLEAEQVLKGTGV